MHRRDFLALAPAAVAAPPPQFLKGICGIIFPPAMPLDQQFQAAKSAGFSGIEIRLTSHFPVDTPLSQAARIAASARKHGIAIISLWAADPLVPFPLNHPDPSVRDKGVHILHSAIDLAKALHCGALLIVPGRLGNGPQFQYSYQDTWDRVSAELRKLLQHAAAARVCLTPENVWNKFLLSPLEMRTFVDQFQSPWLQTAFDAGNVMQFGYPQDWILTLGPRIRRVHIKDYKLSTRSEQGRFVPLLEGDVQWKEVLAALKSIRYRGFLSPEISHDPADPTQLTKVSHSLDQILSLA